jgi:drug/metabolite transporter (DMT)-like permease
VAMNSLDPTEKQLKTYGLMMAGVLSCLAALFIYKTWHTPAMALGIWVLFFLMLALFAPTRLERIYQAWMRFAKVIGNFNFKLILCLLYFVMFTPVRMVALLFREDPLTRKIEPEKKSYWHDCEPRNEDPKRFEKQF